MQPQNRLLQNVELARMWSQFHKDWLLAIRGLIRPQLPSEYAVFVESEIVLISPSDHVSGTIMPDIGISHVPRPRESHPSSVSSDVTAAVLEFEESCELYSTYSLLVRRAPNQRLVAALEIVSPTNKGTYGKLDKDKYLRKRDLYFEAAVNLLEVDALTSGQRILPPAVHGLSEYKRTAWTVLHDGGTRKFTGWGWNDDDPLPKVPWTVEPGLRVVVDLALAATQAWEFNPWDMLTARP